MGIKFAQFARIGFWLLLIMFMLVVASCSGSTPVPSIQTPTLEPTATLIPAVISPQTVSSLALEKSIGSGAVQSAAWSPDGKTLALATSLRVDLYDAVSFQSMGALETGQWNNTLAYSPDGKLLAVSGELASIQIWDASQRRPLLTLEGSQSQIYEATRLFFSPDSTKLIASTGQKVRIWDASSGQIIDTFPGYTDGITSLALSPDGKLLVVASSRKIYVRNLVTREFIYQPLDLPEKTESISYLFFELGGKRFITVGVDDLFLKDNAVPGKDYQTKIRYWDINSGKMLVGYDASENSIDGAAFSPDGHWIAISNDTGLEFWDTATQKISFSLAACKLRTLAFSPDAHRLVTVSCNPQVWDLSTQQPVKTFDEYSDTLYGTAFSPDGKLAAIGGAKIQVRELATGQIRYTLDGNQPMTFSPDGDILAFARSKDSITVVDAGTGKNLTSNISCPALTAIAFSPDNTAIAYGGENCKVMVQDIHAGKVLHSLDKAQDNDGRYYVDNLVFSPDGRKLVVAGFYTIEIWDIRTEKLLQTIEMTGYDSHHQVAFSPDGHFLAITGWGDYRNSKVKIYDTASGQPVFILTTSQNQISKLAFSPDGQVLAIGGENTFSERDNKLELWDAWSGQPLSKFENTTDRMVGLGFSADGQMLLSARFDGSVHLWHSRTTAVTGSSPRSTPTSQPTPLPTLAASEFEISKITELGKGLSSQLYRSKDGKLAAYFEGNLLKWFQGASMVELGSIEVGEDFMGGVTFSPDDKLIILESGFGAQLVDLATKSIIGRVSGGNGSTDGYVFTKDGKYMAYLMHDYTSGGSYERIGLWNIVEGKEAFTEYDYFPTLLSDRYHTMTSPAISPDDTLVAAGHSDQRVYVWDLHSGKTRFILEGHAQSVTSVDFSSNGQFLASSSMDGTIRLWSPTNGKLVRVLTGFSQGIKTIKFSPDNHSLIVNTFEDKPALIYYLENDQITPAIITKPAPDSFELKQYQQGYSEGYIDNVLFSPDGNTVALGRLGVGLWEAGTGKLLRFINVSQWGGLFDMIFSPDGGRLAVATYDSMLLILDTRNGQPVLTLQGRLIDGKTIYSVVNASGMPLAVDAEANYAREPVFSPNGRLLAFGNAANIEIWDLDQANKVLSLETNKVKTFVTGISFSQDGKRLFAIVNAEDGKSAQTWDVQTGQLLRTFSMVEPNGYTFGAFALQGSLFARNNTDENGSWIELWNLETDQFIRLDTPSAENNPLVLSPDGKLLLALNNSELYFWNTGNGQLIYKTKVDFYSGPMDISPDNKTLAIGREDKGELWDIRQVEQLAQKAALTSPAPATYIAPAVIAWPTATPQPTASLPAGSASASVKSIGPVNASQVKEISRFGQGTIDQVNWSPSGDTIVIAGSLGVFQYDKSLNEKGHLEIAGWTNNVVSLSDGSVLTTSTNAGRVLVHDMGSGKILADFEGGEPSISQDGKLLVYQNKDGDLKVWDIANHQIVATLLKDYHYSYDKSYQPYWSEVVFSPDGKLVAAVPMNDSRFDYHNSARVWNVKTGKIVNALGGPDNSITDLSFSMDGKFLVGAAGGSAWLWSINPGTPPETISLYNVEIKDNLNIYTHTVTSAGISPDDQIIAVGTSERMIWLYDRKGNVLKKMDGHASPIHRLRFSPDGKTLLSVDEDGVIILWDVASGKRLSSQADHAGEILGLNFQTDGTLGAWQAGAAWVIQPQDGKLLQTTRTYSGTILAASPTGDWLAVYDPFHISLWDAHSGKFRQTLEGEAEDPFVDYQYEGLVLRGFSGAAFSPDGSKLATAGTGGIWVYNTLDGKLLQQFPGTNATKLAFSPDNQWLLTCIYEQVQPPAIFDLETGAGIFTLDENSRGSDFLQYAFSPDKRFVGAVKRGWDNPDELVLYDIVSKQIFKRLPFDKNIKLTSLAFNPAVSLIAIGQADGQISLVDLSELRVISILTGHHGSVDHLAFSPDGLYLVSGSSDGTIRTWGIP